MSVYRRGRADVAKCRGVRMECGLYGSALAGTGTFDSVLRDPRDGDPAFVARIAMGGIIALGTLWSARALGGRDSPNRGNRRMRSWLGR